MDNGLGNGRLLTRLDERTENIERMLKSYCEKQEQQDMRLNAVEQGHAVLSERMKLWHGLQAAATVIAAALGIGLNPQK